MTVLICAEFSCFQWFFAAGTCWFEGVHFRLYFFIVFVRRVFVHLSSSMRAWNSWGAENAGKSNLVELTDTTISEAMAKEGDDDLKIRWKFGS